MAKINIEFYSKNLARKVDVSLIIPTLNLHESLNNKDLNYYQNRDKKFPLMICLCGFGDNNRTWLSNTNIESLADKYQVACAFINGENKWYLNNGPIENHYDFIENDLLDFLYGNFTNLSKDAPLIIGGVSMGGYGSLYHYLTNIDKYDAAFALSPATKPDFIDETNIGTLKSHFLKNKDHKLNIYLSIGTKDFIIGASKEFNNFLKANEIDCEYRFIEDKDHSWNLWKDEIVEVFNYLETNKIIG